MAIENLGAIVKDSPPDAQKLRAPTSSDWPGIHGSR
jgi:hypothetical protein